MAASTAEIKPQGKLDSNGSKMFLIQYTGSSLALGSIVGGMGTMKLFLFERHLFGKNDVFSKQNVSSLG